MPSPLNYLQIGAVHLDVSLPASSQEARGALQPAEVDLLVLESSGGRHVESGQARRAMEQLAARHAQDAIRVATLTPSGRPIALRCGDLAGMQVSASHAGGLIVAACRTGSKGVGVDLVDPLSAGPGLDWWDSTDSTSLKTNHERVLSWAAREAAYKAARLDAPFAPSGIHVTMLGDDGFAWQIGTPGGPIAGRGCFFRVGEALLAVAVEQEAVSTAKCADEVAACS